jgi:adenylate kinase family enzyme
MINVCEKCGQYRNDKIVNKENSNIICPECGHIKSYKLLPLFMVSGASGSGKSTICNYFAEKTNSFIVLDMDILWNKYFDKPENNYKDFFETWLRMAKNISQADLSVVLFGAGCIPKNIEDCIEKRYFSEIHYLGLICKKETLEKRLNNRPKWRKSSDKEFIEKQIEYNNYIKTNKEIKKFETDNITIEGMSEKIKKWVEEAIKKE